MLTRSLAAICCLATVIALTLPAASDASAGAIILRSKASELEAKSRKHQQEEAAINSKMDQARQKYSTTMGAADEQITSAVTQGVTHGGKVKVITRNRSGVRESNSIGAPCKALSCWQTQQFAR
jgi:hypothetical protein